MSLSLTDALLLDPHRDVHDVWIAVRTDGQRGSGTIDDPYDGGTDERFDLLMNSLPTYARIHLGPGTFETKGYFGGWGIKEGQKIAGSGIDITTLKLVKATKEDMLHVAITTRALDGTAYFAHHCEVSDLTVDANLPGQPNSPGRNYANLACGAVFIAGSYSRVRRVKAIRWGTQTPQAEGFVIFTGFAFPGFPEIVNPVIEDCLCVQPSENNARECTVIGIGGHEDPFHVQVFSRGGIVRRNFVDCSYSGGRASHINTVSSLTRSGTTAICRTVRKHGLLPGSRTVIKVNSPSLPEASPYWSGYFGVTPDATDEYLFTYAMAGQPEETSIAERNAYATVGGGFQAVNNILCRSGIMEDNVVLNAETGGPWQDAFSTRDLIVRRNHYRNVTFGPRVDMGRLSDPPLKLVSITQLAVGSLEAQTVTNHGFADAEQVRIQFATPTALDRDTFITVVGAKTFRFSILGYNSGNETGGIAVVERTGAGLKPIVSSGSASLVYLGSGMAEAETMADDHKLAVGDRIKVINATHGLTDFTERPEFIGFFEITEVPALNKFRYKTKGIPSGNAFNATFQRVWGIDRLVIEDNHIEIREWFPGEVSFPFGIVLVDNVSSISSPPPPYTHLELVVRGNSVRFIDGTAPPVTNDGRAIQLNGFRNVIIADNVLDWKDPNPIRTGWCGTVDYLNNRTPAGALIRGHDYITSKTSSELQVNIEDAVLLSI